MAKHLRSSSPATPSGRGHEGGEEKQPERDFISHLPDRTLHLILSKLQLRDAAVTTAVAKRWAPLFPTLPSVTIDALSFDPRDTAMDDQPDFEHTDEWLDALFSVLDSRRAPFKEFRIAVEITEHREDVFYQVFRRVCEAGVEELAIHNSTYYDSYKSDLYTIPLPVFSCKTIVKLELFKCRLVVPSKLTGLPAVKSLVLSQISVADDHLKRMISHCKGLEQLVIEHCFTVRNIVICAPTLLDLEISLCKPAEISLQSSPRLVSVQVLFRYDYDLWSRYDMPEEEKDMDFYDNDLDFNLRLFEKAFVGSNVAASLTTFLNGLCGVKNVHLEFANEFRMVCS